MAVGRKIFVTRRASGLSLRDLSERIDNRVTAQAISKYEREESVPSSDVLYSISDALGVTPDYLASDQEIHIEAVDFRRKRLTSKREEAQVKSRVMLLLQRYLTVEERLRLATVKPNFPREAPWPVVRDEAEAEHAALGLRMYWGIGLDPISNLVDLLEERGIKVFSIGLDNIDGLTAKVRRDNGNTVFAVVVNRGDCGERQRFTIAHELGHMIIDVSPGEIEEKVANRFAGAFLMPAETLRSKFGKHRRSVSMAELLELKRIFGVSAQALVYRCKELGIFSTPLARNLFRLFEQLGWRSPPYKEIGGIEPEKPKRFERLCYRALSEGAISQVEASEILGQSAGDLIRRMYDPVSAMEQAER